MTSEKELRTELEALDEQGNQIMARMQMRRAMRAEWIANNISMSASDADQRYIIDGHTDDGDVRAMFLNNKRKMEIITILAPKE